METESSSQVLKVLDDIREVDPSICVVGGIKFKMRKVSRILIVDASKKIKTPKPPVMMIESKGREEENPADPDYQEALQDANYQKAMVVVNAYIVLGTKPLEVPDTIEPLESNTWIEDLAELGVGFEAPKTDRSRYLQWLKYVALGDEQLNELVQNVMRYSGITLESDVKQAQEGFRSNEEGNTNRGGSTT